MKSHRYPLTKRFIYQTTAVLSTALLTAGAATVTSPPAQAENLEVGSAELVPVQITGEPEDRFSLVILSDGYTEEEFPKFREQVEEHMNVMWSLEPFKSYRNYFNVYAVEIVSEDSGVSCDNTLDDPQLNTPLGMSFWGGCNENSVERLLTVNGQKAEEYAELAPKVDQILAMGNSDTYGGAGGKHATVSGGNALSALIAPHEIGHSLGGLQDEYDYYDRGETTGDYTGEEPSSKHHTIMTEEEMRETQSKWWRWLGEESESGGTIGLHEGGMYSSTGVYRPSQHSMMKALGFYFDQISREIMTEKISAQTELVPASTPEGEVAQNSVLWVSTAQPVYHELDVTWSVNGNEVKGTENSRDFSLTEHDVELGSEITATVVDNTDFVRDPDLRSKASMTQQRTWTVVEDDDASTDNETAQDATETLQESPQEREGDKETTLDTPTDSQENLDAEDEQFVQESENGEEQPQTAATERPVPEIIASSPTDRTLGGEEILFVETTRTENQAYEVVWTVDGEVVDAQERRLDLAQLDLGSGPFTVEASVSDPENSESGADTVSWLIDNQPPTVAADVSEPIKESTNAQGEPHYTVEEQFEMKLEATDDQEGYVVMEFRLDGDGWMNYYGWPTDKDAPFLFTPTGINIDDLIYGNLGTGGVSLSPFQEREPGYGDHRVEYRGIDAAGNIGEVGAFTVTVLEQEDDNGGDNGDGDASDGDTGENGGVDADGGTGGDESVVDADGETTASEAGEEGDLADTGSQPLLWGALAVFLIAGGATALLTRRSVQSDA